MDEGDVLHILIKDETGDTFTVVLNSIDDSGNDNEEEVPSQPLALAASDITSTEFTANWQYMENALGYYLDVAEDSGFTMMVAGYNNLDVSFINSYDVIGLVSGTPYYYRIRAYNDIGTSVNSNTISLNTMAGNWFLPSRDELNEMYVNLHLFGIGNFVITTTAGYWTSTEFNALYAYYQLFDTGSQTYSGKNSAFHVRPCRKFTAGVGEYSLRDVGPAGGWIFYVDGTTYMEAAVANAESAGYIWSNIINSLIGTTSADIGEGQNNTNEIIGQAGHTDSAAKLCDDLIL
jgi:hypothetical protein